jgi:phage terminase Nu1 subunit (DNA packaging protein)
VADRIGVNERKKLRSLRGSNPYQFTSLHRQFPLGIMQYRETAKEIEPLLKAVAELDAKEEAERSARQRAETDLSLAREAAKARALENVDNDAAVISARERLREVSS